MSDSFATQLQDYLLKGGTHCLCPRCAYPTLVGRGVDALEWTCVACGGLVQAPVLPIEKRAVKLCFSGYTSPEITLVAAALQRHGVERIGKSERLTEFLQEARMLKRQAQQQRRDEARIRREKNRWSGM